VSVPETPNSQGTQRRWTRRDFLRVAGGAALGLVAVACGSESSGDGGNGGGGNAPAVISSATKDVYYDGEIFDAGGATLRLADWPGFWEEMQRKYLLDQFEKDFNCKIEYDGSFPWFPKFMASGPKEPAFDVANWNLFELFKTAKAGDFFVPIEELKENVPNSKDLWDFAFRNGYGITYTYSQYGYIYRSDLVDPPPTSFKDFWEERFAGKRGTYITSNSLQMTFFMMASLVFGKDETDLEAGFKAMEDAMPMKISDFTGNMQALAERGEVLIAVQHDGEAYLQMDKGVPIGWMYWTERQPILTQTKTVSRYSQPIQKKLAYALIQRSTDPAYLEAVSKENATRPTNKNAKLPEVLASKGLDNTAEAAEQLWIPPWDWYIEHEQEINERVNRIFSQ